MSREDLRKNKQKNKPRSMTSLMLQRWWDVTLYGVLSSLIAWICIQSTPEKLEKSLAAIESSNAWAISALAVAALIGLIVKLRLFRPKHIKTWLNHPPLLFSPLLAVNLIAIFDGNIEAAAWLFVTVLVLIFCLSDRVMEFKSLGFGAEFVSPLPDQEIASMGQVVADWPVEKIHQWIERELPSSDNVELLFCYEHYVADIYNKLIATNGSQPNRAKTLALIGEYGSGKSSIFGALKSTLPDNWIVVDVDAWDRKASRLDEQILELVIEKLAEYTDVSGYRDLPAQYHKALDKQGSVWAIASILSKDSPDAAKRLESIEQLLELIQKKLLIVIEDPDRGAEADKDSRMSRVFSLIDRIKQSSSHRIKAVVSCNKTALNGDYRAIEFKTVVQTPSRQFASVANRMVELWCPSQQIRDGSLVLPNGPPSFSAELFPDGTPRDFKHALREVSALWGVTDKPNGPLRGEIDLELLVLLSFVWELQFDAGGSVAFKYIQLALRAPASKSSTFYSQDRTRNHYKWSRTGSINRKFGGSRTHQQRVELASEISGDLAKEIAPAELALAHDVANTLIGYNSRELQAARSNDRIDYIQRFFDRHSETRWGQDVDIEKLLPEEMLKDQDYLQAMNRLVRQVDSTSSVVEFKKSDLKKLLYSGGLSQYFYDELTEKLGDSNYSNSQKAVVWKSLANAIIDSLESFKYTENENGNPAGQHIAKCLSGLENSGVPSLALELLLEALSKASSAGLEVLAQEYYLVRGLSVGAEWMCIMKAVFNPTLSHANLGHDTAGIDISWSFLFFIQKRDNLDQAIIEFKKCRDAHSYKNESIEAIDELDGVLDRVLSYEITMSSAYDDFYLQHEAKRSFKSNDRVDTKDQYIKWLKYSINQL